MHGFPSPHPNAPKVCSGCRAAVLRKDCHKSRYGDYLCRSCQAAGVKFTYRSRLRHGTRRAAWFSWVAGLVLLLVAVVGWTALSLFEHIDILGLLRPPQV